jgi:general secretion pathway protein G
MKKSIKGFTIVELLIVIVVIGILAAITIVAYNGVQARANDTRRASSVKTIAGLLEIFYQDNGRYPVYSTELSSSTWAATNIPALNSANLLTAPGSSATTYPYSLLTGTSVAKTEYRYENYNTTYGDCTATKCDHYRLRWLRESDNTTQIWQSAT